MIVGRSVLENMENKLSDNASAFIQLDIFDFLKAAEEPEKSNPQNAISPNELSVGDIVDFVSYGGKSLRGTFITKGFWDGRDQADPQYYYFDVEGRFYEIDPSRCSGARIGHDDDYVKPGKDDITERLVDHLKKFAFPDRLGAYRNFQNQYPYLSYEYQPYVSGAWDKAIVDVTTMEEVMSNLKHWSLREKFPQEVKQYLAEKILSLDSEERLSEMFKMEWQELAWKEGKQKIFCAKRLVQKTFSVYEPLLQTLIKKASNAQELISVASIWETTSKIIK